MKLLKLALVLEQEQLHASVWGFGLGGWHIVRTERVAMPSADPLLEQVLAAIRPLITKWGLPPDIPVIAVAPPGMGGILSYSFPRSAGKDLAALVDFELARALPFSLKEVERGFQSRREGDRILVSVFWLPKSWVGEFRNALARAGFRLSELCHRAQLIGAVLGGAGESGPWGCVEQNSGNLDLHFYRHGALPDRSRRLQGAASARLGQELALDLVALSGAGLEPRRICLAGVGQDTASALQASVPAKLQAVDKIVLPEALLALWRGGGSGIWLMPDKGLMAARLIPVVIIFTLLGAIGSGTVWWLMTQQRDSAAVLDEEARQLKPRYQKAIAMEHAAIRAQQELTEIDAALAGPSPLEMLNEVHKALPEQAWLMAFNYTGSGVEIEGYGIDAGELGKILAQGGAFGGIAPYEPRLATDSERQPFALGMKWIAGKK